MDKCKDKESHHIKTGTFISRTHQAQQENKRQQAKRENQRR